MGQERVVGLLQWRSLREEETRKTYRTKAYSDGPVCTGGVCTSGAQHKLGPSLGVALSAHLTHPTPSRAKRTPTGTTVTAY